MDRRVKIPEYKLRNAIKKTAEFKEFITVYKERMREFSSYYSAVKLEYYMAFDVTFKYFHKDWADKDLEETCKVYLRPEDTLVVNGNCNFMRKPAETFAKLLTRHVLDTLEIQHMRWFHIIRDIEVKCNNLSIDRMFAWDETRVAFYHIEQECGEGWYILPLHPQADIQTYINIQV